MIRLNNRLSDFIAKTQISATSMQQNQEKITSTISQVVDRVAKIEDKLDAIEKSINKEESPKQTEQRNQAGGVDNTNGILGGNLEVEKPRLAEAVSRVDKKTENTKPEQQPNTDSSTKPAVLKKRKSPAGQSSCKKPTGKLKTSNNNNITLSRQDAYSIAKSKSIKRIGPSDKAQGCTPIPQALERVKPGCNSAKLYAWLGTKAREVLLSAKPESQLKNINGQVKKIIISFSEQSAEKQKELTDALELSFYQKHGFSIASQSSWVAKRLIQRAIAGQRQKILDIKSASSADVDHGDLDYMSVLYRANEKKDVGDRQKKDTSDKQQNDSNGKQNIGTNGNKSSAVEDANKTAVPSPGDQTNNVGFFADPPSDADELASDVAMSSGNASPTYNGDSRTIEFGVFASRIKETSRVERETRLDGVGH
ncbi:hypothetical protein IWW45_001249 [Coemansia sp. RSA 485]|nr:hypothetical protein IWW45_001249 [Coemansia sp. RSA 485]